MNTRELIRQDLPFDHASILEIGALNKPFIRKNETNVIYVDHADTETLRQKYAVGHGFDPLDIVDVDAVWGQNSLSECLEGRSVDYVIASHVIEHVPDLVTWLNELSSILNGDGEIRLVIPDKRFTFDYTRRPTEMPEVIDAYIRRARRPQAWNILDHVLNVRAVDGQAAWRGPLPLEQTPNLHGFEQAIGVAEDAINNGTYHDVHCWVFTPESFARLMAAMVQYGLIDLACQGFRDTQQGTIEFVAFLRRTSDKAAAIESWNRMGDQVGGGSAQTLDDARRELAAIKASHSWRITAPLRLMVSVVRSRTNR